MIKRFFWRGFLTGAIVFLIGCFVIYKNFMVQSDVAFSDMERNNEQLDGTEVNMKDIVGKPLVVNYWATWCAPCIAEFPIFEKLKKEYGNDVNFIMISDENNKKIIDFSQKNSYQFNYLRSKENLSVHGINARPVTFFYNKNGEQITKQTGGLTEEILRSKIEEIK